MTVPRSEPPGLGSRLRGIGHRTREIGHRAASFPAAVREGLHLLALGLHSSGGHRVGPRLLRWVGVSTVILAGSALGASTAPAVTTQVGPLTAEIRVVPSWTPGVHLLLAPIGQVSFDTHRAPMAVEGRISEVDLDGARRLVASPGGLEQLQRVAPDELRTATVEAAALTGAWALAGALILSLLVYRRSWWRTAEVGAGVLAVVVVLGGVTVLSFNADRFAQPRFTGLLSRAPYVAGETTSLVQRLQNYRAGLADVVQSVTSLYASAGQFRATPDVPSGDLVTVLHISDLHNNPLGFDLTERLVQQFRADLVVDTGDITSWGTDVESEQVARIGRLAVPYVFVRGNHDSAGTEAALGRNRNAVVLDGNVVEVKGLVIAGIGDPYFTPDHEPVPVKPIRTPTPAPGVTPSRRPVPVAAPAPSGSPAPGLEERAGQRLAEVVQAWNAGHPGNPVRIAAVHEPYADPPLLGQVPLLLNGHMHSRSTTVDSSGTRVMVQGSTGGAGVDSLLHLSTGKVVPLTATLLYFARSGTRAGQLVAYDEVTVGGLGLTSISLERTVLRPQDTPAPTPTPGATPGVTPGATPGTPGSPGATAATPEATATPGPTGSPSRAADPPS